MGNCIYCGKPAGFLRKKHKECENKFNEGKKEIINTIHLKAIDGHIDDLNNYVEMLCKNNFINNEQKNNFIRIGWEDAVETAFDDGILTEKEEENLSNILETLSLTQDDVDKNGYYTKLVKGSVLREVLNGNIPNSIANDKNSLPFNFQKSEQVIWLFSNVDYYEQKTKRQYTGGSQGVSVRIAKGLYYRVGAFKGESINVTETVHSDTGLMAITNKHIYFSGSQKSFRVNFNKIVSFQPYEDGIGLQKDGVTAKPQIFKTGDGWFTYNLVSNISQL